MTSNKRSIPEIRQRLYELADELGVDELRQLADETFRRSPKKRARTRSPKLTPSLAAEIRRYSREHPDAHQQDIANEFDVNHGRVSEALDHQV